jgi:hypothetical protein
MNNLEDKDNLNPEYQFILNNLHFLTTDCNLFNIEKNFPTRDKFSVMLNLRLLNLKNQIVRDVLEGKDEFIYLNAYQWQTIVNTIKENEKKKNAI